MPPSARRTLLLILIGMILGLILSPFVWLLLFSDSPSLQEKTVSRLCPDLAQTQLIQNQVQTETPKIHFEAESSVSAPRDPSIRRKQIKQELVKRGILFTGVLTAKKYLNTRALAIWNTWGKELPDIHFFSSPPDDPILRQQLPIITLPGINDTEYPPQKKVYRMLKYMHDNYINDFDFFMRADDDSYIKTDRLLELLQNTNPAQDIYMGEPGFGRSDDLERLKLKKTEHYCMGGPGVIFSRSALRKLAPHLEECLKVRSSVMDILFC